MADSRDEITVDTDARRTIARLAGDTLPRLIDRLMRSELGELEVRENGWRIRLRRANATNGASDSQASGSRERSRRSPASTSAGHQDRSGGQGRSPGRRSESVKGLVTSPAVGYFVARDGVSVGTRVRQGDVIGQVDVLGVSQEVVASLEGTIGAFEVEAGQAIEFGQPVARVEPAGSRATAETDQPAEAPEEALGQLVEA
jgi:acetyl-CoA carboxylase biotin carboxyl carrier protein